MLGLGKLLQEKKVVGLAKILLEQSCNPKKYFVKQEGAVKKLLNPTDNDDEMKELLESACSSNDACANDYYTYYVDKGGTASPEEVGCDGVVAGEDDDPSPQLACKNEGAETEEDLRSWALENGWMIAGDAKKEPIIDKRDPDNIIECPNGMMDCEDNGGTYTWPGDSPLFFEKKDFFDDVSGGADKCELRPLYKKKEVEDELYLPEPEYATLESFCDDNALLKAGDGSWTGFYKFKYKDGLETCLVDNWTYVSAMGISYGTGEDRCWDYVRVPRSMPVPGATYNMPVKLSFYRVNAGCVTGKWKSQQMIVDPDTNFGGKKRVQGQNQSLNPSRVFDRKNYNPYGSGQSSPNTSGGDPYASARDRLAYNPEAFEYIDDGEEVVTTSRTTNNPLRGYGGLIDDIFA